MGKLRILCKKHPGLSLVLGSYAAGVLVFFLIHLGLFCANRVQYATGALREQELTIADFELVGMVEQDGVLVTLDADPQMLLRDPTTRVENFTAELEYLRTPRTRTAFWAKPGQDYSLRDMAYSFRGEGETYYLPATGGQSFRFDPDTTASNVITVRRLAINTPRPFWAFFLITPMQWVVLVVAPGLAASVAALVRTLLPARPRKTQKEAPAT